MQSEYARLSGLSEAALMAAIEPYLPIAVIVRLFILLGGPYGRSQWGSELMQRVEAALRRAD